MSSPMNTNPFRLTRLALMAAMLGVTALAPAHAQVTATTATANAEIDPPGRVARIGYFDNSVSFLPAGSQEWESAMLNRPIIAGDQLATDAGARAEMHVGSTALRLGSQTQASFSRLDDDEAFITVQQGTLSLRVRQLFPGEHLEVNTPNIALSITQPGEYRVDVNAAGGTTRVTVPSGGGVIYGEGGQTVAVGSPQQLTFSGRNLAQVSAQNAAPRDAFDQWTMARDRQEDQSISARYVSREVVGYQQLDAYGDWATDATYGNIWYPRVTVANWAPYRYGQWRYVAPWGWTWVDDAPWGFAPSHYGRWTQVGPRWGWVPGPIAPRPVYAPALVAFIGGSSGGVNWNVSIGGGGSPGVGWFPLAPGEAYRPAYRASPRYVTNINRTIVVNNNVTNVYRFNRPEAVTAIPRDAFQRGRPTGGFYQRLAQADLDRGRVVDRPDARPDPRWRNDGDRGGRDSRGEWNDRNGDRRPDFRPGIAQPPQPDGRNTESMAEQIRRRQQEATRNDNRERDNMTWEQRQQLQNRRDQERNAVAEQQQRALQDGARRQQQEQEERVRRQQTEQQERVQRQQAEQQQRAQQQQGGMMERIQRQQAEQAEQQRRAQQQQQMQQQREGQQREQQQREFQQRAQRQQMEQQERAQQQQRQMQERQVQEQRQSQERQRQQQAENEARSRGQFNGQQGGPPQKPMRPGMRPGDNDRS